MLRRGKTIGKPVDRKDVNKHLPRTQHDCPVYRCDACEKQDSAFNTGGFHGKSSDINSLRSALLTSTVQYSENELSG